MGKLVLIVAIGFAIWTRDMAELPFMSPAGAFDQKDNPVVWKFTVKGCAKPCKDERNGLKPRRVAFETGAIRDTHFCIDAGKPEDSGFLVQP